MKADLKRLPPGFLERLKQILPASKWKRVTETFARSTPTTFRTNTLKCSVRDLKQKLEKEGLGLASVRWYPEAFMLTRDRLRDLQKTDAYQNGELYVQSLSSMVPPLVLEPHGEETVLDLTAAPGSKTTQMAAMMKGTGVLRANDNNKIRFFKLKANVEAQGAENVRLSMQYGESFGRNHPGAFDRVLVDAPCSAEGRFDIRRPASFGFWKPRKIKEMVRKQKKLLYSGIQALRSGGTLVYSTCTFAPEENEGILDWALEKFPGGITIEPVRLAFPNQMPGLTKWNGRVFDPAVTRGVRILPDAVMEGFFVAKIKKAA